MKKSKLCAQTIILYYSTLKKMRALFTSFIKMKKEVNILLQCLSQKGAAIEWLFGNFLVSWISFYFLIMRMYKNTANLHLVNTIEIL